MKTLIRSRWFNEWFGSLRDNEARKKISARLDRLAAGNFGDVKPIGQGLSEMRIHCGAGYRVYFMQRGKIVVILLCGGDKSSQNRDIENAKIIAQKWKG